MAEEPPPAPAPEEHPQMEPERSASKTGNSMDNTPRPSLWRELRKKCSRVFWTWWGMPDIADDIETHGTTVKKAAVITFLIVLSIVVFGTAYWLKGSIDGAEVDSLTGELQTANGAKQEAEMDRNKYQTLYNQDENSVGQLRQIANAKFAQAPPDQRVDLLLNKMESLQSDLDSSLQTLAPRKISDQQRRFFIEALKNKVKGPIAVIVLANGAEVTDFANQMRSMLDDAGYADPDKKNAEYSWASYQTEHPASSFMAALPDDKCLQGGPVQDVLKAMGIPADGTTDKVGVLGLKPNEVAFVILAK